MPRHKKDVHRKQDGKFTGNKNVVKARKQGAVSSNVKNPTSKTANYNHLQGSAVARSTAVVPTNISLSENISATISNRPTVISVPSTSSFTPRNTERFHPQNPQVSILRLPSITNGRIRDYSANQENNNVAYIYSVNSGPPERLVDEVDLTRDTVNIFRLPSIRNERNGDLSGNQENDDVTYLYTVDSSPVVRLADEVDLTQDSEVENPGPSKKNVTKPQKNQKRKIEEDEVSSKRNKISDVQPMCSICDIHNDSLIEIAENMFIGSCGHLFCAPCTRKMKISDCEICRKKINALRKVFF